MTRKYAFLLILTGLALLGNLIWLHFQLREMALAEYQQVAQRVHANTLERTIDEIDQLVMRLDDRLMDDAKAKFRPILPFFEEIRKREKDLLLKIGDNQKLLANDVDKAVARKHFLKLFVEDRLHRKAILAAATDLLGEYGENFDLNAQDIVNALENFREYNEETRLVLPKNASRTMMEIHLDLLALAFLNFEKGLLQSVANMSGGRTLSCFFGPRYFPIISNGFNTAKKGELLETRIRVGTFFLEANPETFRVVIHGDTLQIQDNGMIPFSFVPQKRGQQRLEIELLDQNPLTGLVTNSFATYTYYVH